MDNIHFCNEHSIFYNSLSAEAPPNAHPLFDKYKLEIDFIREMYYLEPSIYYIEAREYHERALTRQLANLENKPPEETVTGCDLQDNVHIYDTVVRDYAGFSNVLEQLWYGDEAPKLKYNKENNFDFESVHPRNGRGHTLADWIYIFIAHRATGSGASFCWDHGWRNNIVGRMAQQGTIKEMVEFIDTYEGKMFTSIGNQIPPFPKAEGTRHADKNAPGGRYYLCDYAPQLAIHISHFLLTSFDICGHSIGIKDITTEMLRWHRHSGLKQYKFVLTAVGMDIAQYFPDYVDPNSDVFHGKNAIETQELLFTPTRSMKKQDMYDQGTRAFAEITKTRPMDVEDAGAGCDFIRWIENYIRDGEHYAHLDRRRVYHKCYVRHPEGRQRWKLSEVN